MHLKVIQSALREALLFLIRDLVYCTRLCLCEHTLMDAWLMLVVREAIDVSGTQLCVG